MRLVLGILLVLTLAGIGSAQNYDAGYSTRGLLTITGGAVIEDQSLGWNSYSSSPLTGMQTVTRSPGTQTGPTQERKQPCETKHIEALAVRVQAGLKEIDIVRAELEVQQKKFQAAFARMDVIQNKLGAMMRTCVGCPGISGANLTNLTNVTITCEKCTTTTIMLTLTEIEAEYIEIQAQITTIKLEIEKLHARIARIKIDLAAVSADLFKCKFDCPPCPPGTTPAPTTGPAGIFCSGGQLNALIAQLDVQIAEIEKASLKLKAELGTLDVTIDTIKVTIAEMRKTTEVCINCVALVNVTEERNQVDVAKEFGLVDRFEGKIISVTAVGTLYHITVESADGRTIIFESSEKLDISGDVTVVVTGGTSQEVTVNFVKRVRFAFMRWLGFATDRTITAKILRIEQGGQRVFSASSRLKGIALPGCGGCSVQTLWQLFIKIESSHKHLHAAFAKIQVTFKESHATFVKVSAKVREIHAAFLKCSFNCPKCVSRTVLEPPREHTLVGTQPRTTEGMVSSPQPQEAISTGQTQTVKKSCDQICGEKGMVPSMPDWSGHILGILNSQGVCKKSANVQFGSYLKGAECTCYPSTPPSVTVSGDLSCNTECGTIPCNSGTSCSCGENCILTVTCKWGGWRQVGAQSFQPVISSESG